MSVIYPECAICFESLDNNLIASVSCGHIFHEKCLKLWIKQNHSVCPLCRSDASITVKLIYNIKFDLNNENDKILTMEELIENNKRLINQNNIIKNQIQQMNEIRDKENKEIKDLIEKYQQCLKNTNEYKNKLLNIQIKYEDEFDKNKKNKILINELEDKIKELEEIKIKYEKRFELEEKFENVLNSNDIEDKQKKLNLIINNLLYEDDDGKSLNEYFYVLSNKIEKLQKENEYLKKHKNEQIKNINNQNNNNKQNTIKMITATASRKRTYNEYLEERKKLNQNEQNDIVYFNTIPKNYNENKISNDNLNKKNNKNSSIHLFADPFTRKFGPSFLKK